jgi:hypothetical protein
MSRSKQVAGFRSILFQLFFLFVTIRIWIFYVTFFLRKQKRGFLKKSGFSSGENLFYETGCMEEKHGKASGECLMIFSGSKKR